MDSRWDCRPSDVDPGSDFVLTSEEEGLPPLETRVRLLRNLHRPKEHGELAFSPSASWWL